MVNTLRRKKDKETPAVVNANGSVSNDSSLALTSMAAPAPATLQTSASVEEKHRTVAAPLKVTLCLMLFVFSLTLFNVMNTASFNVVSLAFRQTFIFCLIVYSVS